MSLDQKLRALQAQVNSLQNEHATLTQKLRALQAELITLQRNPEDSATSSAKADLTPDDTPKQVQSSPPLQEIINKPPSFNSSANQGYNTRYKSRGLEAFIGENLINKVGIIVLIIGVAIGANYAVEHELIGPGMRIVMGYGVGLILMGIAYWMRHKFRAMSAVMLSGSAAIMYLVTYAAHSLFKLIPQLAAFALMVVFTAFTVWAALQYRKQIIAHVGMVGAYAIPFLLSDGSGNANVLFSYILIINCGILVVAFKQYWKLLYFTTFGFTWLIFFSWYFTGYNSTHYFTTGIIFSTAFYVLLYAVFLVFKVAKSEPYTGFDLALLLANSLLYFTAGYLMLSDVQFSPHLQGVFCLFNSAIHVIVAITLMRKANHDEALVDVIAGLAVLFLGLSIPIELDGSWVTILWVGQASLLFWVSRSKSTVVFERLAYGFLLLSFFSLLDDWSDSYGNYSLSYPESYLTPFLNIHFITSLAVALGAGFIAWFHQQTLLKAWKAPTTLVPFIHYGVPAVCIFAAYNGMRLEVFNYWDQLYEGSYANNQFNHDYLHLAKVWQVNYTLLFIAALMRLNQLRFKQVELRYFNAFITVGVVLVSLISGLYNLSELRSSYLDAVSNPSISFVFLRYVFIALFALVLVIGRIEIMQLASGKYGKTYRLFAHAAVVWVLSSELIHWYDIAGYPAAYKLGMSILWGAYAAGLLSIGIAKSWQHLRIGSLVLFGATLLKVVLFDLQSMGTLAKTFVFMVLGALLLLASFLYNKHKGKMD